MIALPLTNAEVFEQRFDQVARERAGYAQRTDQPLGGTRIALYENGSKQRLAQAVVRGYGLVGRGPEAAAEIAATASRGRAQSLAQEPRLASARLKIGAQDLIAFAPGGSELPRRWVARPLPGDVLLGLSGSAQGVTARLFAQLPQAYAQIALALIPGGGAALAGLLPAAAPVRARLGLAPSLVPSQLARIPALAAPLEELRAAMKSSGADLDQDLFGALEPGLVFSIGVSPRINLGRTVDLSFLDWRHRSPFDTFQLVALAGVHDKPRLLRALAAVAQTLPLFGAKAARSGDDFAVTYAAAQAGSQAPPAAPQEGARFGVRSIAGKDVAYLLGAFAPEALTDAARKSGPPVFFGDPGLVLLLDVGKLAATLHALPEEAYGSGPQTYVAHSIVNQAVEPLKPLRLTASAQALPEGISAELVLEIVAAP